MRNQTGAFGSFTIAVLTLALLSAAVAPPIVSGEASRTTAPLHLPESSLSNELTKKNSRQTRAAQTYRKAPISFEANEGQADRSVKFLARGVGYQLHLTSTQAVLSLKKEAGGKEFRSRQNSRRSSLGDVVRMTLLRARSDATVSGEDVLPGKVNYLLGKDREAWRTNVATYGKVRYKGLYKGIDLVYYGNQRSLEYDFHLAPGANPEEIRLGIEGAKRTEIDPVTGDLIMRLASGEIIRQHKPVLYQEINGSRKSVAGRFVFRGRNQIGFEVGAYDKSRALVIDPVLEYATYFGGAGNEGTSGIAVDGAGSVYVVGWFRTSAGFPVTPDAFQKTQNNSNGDGEVFITKFTPDGAGMVYSTLLGGNSTDVGADIALDPAGNAYVVGWTDSSDFPTRNAYQSTLRGFPNAFVTKLNATGSDLLYSTFLGGSNSDLASDIAVDSSGNAFITGDTGSINFPVTPGALRTTLVRLPSPFGEQDGFVAKLNTNAAGEASLVYSTFIDINASNSIAIDAAGNSYITGDGRVQKLNASGSALVYSFIIPDATTPTNSRLHTTDIAVDGSGQAYVTGFETRFFGETSPNLKTVNGLQPTFGGGLIDGFLVKLNTAGTALLYSTYLGGTSIDLADAVAVDSTGNAYVVGQTASADFPLRDAFQTVNVGWNDTDLFITKIDTNAVGPSSLLFSTYYGGSNFDEGAAGVAVDSEGNIYTTGSSFYVTTIGIIHTGKIPEPLPDDDIHIDPFILKIANTSANVIRFGSERSSASEGAGSFEVTVVREGDSSAAANVDFATVDGTAEQGSDYTATNGTLHFEPGETAKTFQVFIKDDTTVEPNETLNVILRENVNGLALAAPSAAELTIIENDAAVQLSNIAFTVTEGAGFANLTVTRVGDTSRTATVLYSTADRAGLQSCTVLNNKASERCDYSTTAGRLQFGIGQTTQSIIIPIVDDALVEGNGETFTVTLSGPVGALLGAATTATITITDNDSSPASQNPIDGVTFFVTQQYIDFLGRPPDPIGLANWTNTLNNCPNSGFGEFDNPSCDRVKVSSAFFLSDEFRTRGYFAYKFYEVGFDRRPTYAEFVPDMAQVGGNQSPDSEVISKTAYTDAFVQRQEFKNRYDALSNSAYVDALESNAEVTLTNKAALVDALNTNQKTRAQVLREIVELQSVTDKFFIRAFVAIQYFGYLRRDPDTIGYDNWVTTLTADPSNFRHMVFGFIYSTEYRQRFGP